MKNNNYNKILEAVNKGIQLALDDFEDIENNSISGDIISTKDVIADRFEIDKLTVDLGLPSGTRWCKYNLGANQRKLTYSADAWYGKYYAWGEIEPNKPVYNWDTYKLKEKYNDNDDLTQLQLEDDAAYNDPKCHKFKIKMPTKEQFEELLKYTTNEWITNYQGIKGLNGRLFISKINSEQLFIPASGCYDGEALNYVGSYCYLWSSSLYLDNSYYAWYLYFSSGRYNIYYYYRCNGFTVRPVIK